MNEFFFLVTLCAYGATSPLHYCPGNSMLPHPENAEVPDVGLNTIQLIKRQGYPVEQHPNVQTPDGYLLELHRIPHGKHNSNSTNKPVVLIMHGIMSSSADWVNTGSKKALGFIMADLGYDVWLGNARGTTWSRRHVKYDPDSDSEFWKFSWHEIGYYDLPTKIDFILAKTGKESLYYVGHSQGTTTFFVMAAERPEYNQKIRYMAALAPIAFMSHVPNPLLQLLARYEHAVAVRVDEFLPDCKLNGLLGQATCAEEVPTKIICHNVMFLFLGYDSNQLNETIFPVIMTNIPAGASTKQLLHYSQEISSGYFCQYDYGPVKNLIVYGQNSAPKYRLDRITAPVGLFYGGNDLLAAISDVDQLSLELGNLVTKFLVPFRKFNHADFLFATEVVSLLYEHVLNDLKNY